MNLKEQIKLNTKNNIDDYILEKYIVGLSCGNGFYEKNDMFGKYKIVFNEKSSIFELGICDTTHIRNELPIEETISIKSDKCLSFLSINASGIENNNYCVTSIINEYGFFVVERNLLEKNKYIFKYYDYEKYLQMFEAIKGNPNNLRYGLIANFNGLKQNMERGMKGLSLDPSINTEFENFEQALEISNLLINNKCEEVFSIVESINNIKNK